MFACENFPILPPPRQKNSGRSLKGSMETSTADGNSVSPFS